MRVAQETGDGNFIHRESLRIELLLAGDSFRAQRADGSDAQNVAFQLTVETVVLKHDVERLVPGNVIENQRQTAVNVGIEHDIQSADFVNQAKEIFQVN